MEAVHRETTENVAIVEQGLLPHIFFMTAPFKEFFIKPALVLSL